HHHDHYHEPREGAHDLYLRDRNERQYQDDDDDGQKELSDGSTRVDEVAHELSRRPLVPGHEVAFVALGHRLPRLCALFLHALTLALHGLALVQCRLHALFARGLCFPAARRRAAFTRALRRGGGSALL